MLALSLAESSDNYESDIATANRWAEFLGRPVLVCLGRLILRIVASNDNYNCAIIISTASPEFHSVFMTTDKHPCDALLA